MSDNKTLGAELPREMARVRDEVLPAYIQLGQAGRFAVQMIRIDLKKASKAIFEGDLAKMILVYKSLKAWRL